MSTKIRPADALDKAGMTTRRTVANIMAIYAAATEEDIVAGKQWYAEAFNVASELAEVGHLSLETAAVVIAHLSPRTSWARNIEQARALIATGEAPGAIGGNLERARKALAATNPWDTFGKAPKTRAFAANILGNENEVTVDVWAARVAGVSEEALSRVGVYDAVAHAYRLAAKRVGITPAAMQAITWVVMRGRAA